MPAPVIAAAGISAPVVGAAGISAAATLAQSLAAAKAAKRQREEDRKARMASAEMKGGEMKQKAISSMMENLRATLVG